MTMPSAWQGLTFNCFQPMLQFASHLSKPVGCTFSPHTVSYKERLQGKISQREPAWTGCCAVFQAGRICTVRDSRGDDESAACGQLGALDAQQGQAPVLRPPTAALAAALAS